MGALIAAASLAARAPAATPSRVVLTATRASDAARMPSLLSEWRQSGVVAAAWLLDSVDSKPSGFASLAVLQFRNESSLERWQKKDAATIGPGIVATQVDMLARGETLPRDSAKAAFAVAQYQVTVSPDKYRQYVEGYVAPEMETLKAQSILTSYFLFVARDRHGAPWQSLLLMEYRDPMAFERRASSMAEAREKLSSNASWKELSDSKQSIRKELSVTQFRWHPLWPPKKKRAAPW
jgi:hypothetical protein